MPGFLFANFLYKKMVKVKISAYLVKNSVQINKNDSVVVDRISSHGIFSKAISLNLNLT